MTFDTYDRTLHNESYKNQKMEPLAHLLIKMLFQHGTPQNRTKNIIMVHKIHSDSKGKFQETTHYQQHQSTSTKHNLTQILYKGLPELI